MHVQQLPEIHEQTFCRCQFIHPLYGCKSQDDRREKRPEPLTSRGPPDQRSWQQGRPMSVDFRTPPAHTGPSHGPGPVHGPSSMNFPLPPMRAPPHQVCMQVHQLIHRLRCKFIVMSPFLVTRYWMLRIGPYCCTRFFSLLFLVQDVYCMHNRATHLDQDQWKLMISGRKGDANTMKNCLLQWREPN